MSQCPVSRRGQRLELVRAVAQPHRQYRAAWPDARRVREKVRRTRAITKFLVIDRAKLGIPCYSLPSNVSLDRMHGTRRCSMTRIIATAARAARAIFVSLLTCAPFARAADTVTVGTVGSPSANLWPIFIGLEKGFFAAEDLKIDLVYVQSSAAVIQQLAAGALHMAVSNGLVDPVRAIDQGAALAIARFEVQAPPYALTAKASIKSLKDLKGKIIAVGGAKDITRIYAERMLAPNGLKPGDYDYWFAGATTARAQALLSGAVDAALLLPPSNFQVQANGYSDLGLTI